MRSRLATAIFLVELATIVARDGAAQLFWLRLGHALDNDGNLGADQISYVDRLMIGADRTRQARLAPTSRPQLFGALSPRETDILQLIAHGLSNKEIARRLDIGLDTVKSHLKSVFTKLGGREALSSLRSGRERD